MFGKKKAMAWLMVLALMISSCAAADSISMKGKVTSSKTFEVYAPIGGTVAQVNVQVGDIVSVGDALASLKTTKVYATQNGNVTGIFGQVGDQADTVAGRYGAVMYVEGESVYSISASTDDAYNATDNKFVHVGEEVRLKCTNDSTSHTGIGVITSIQGTDYTVEVTEGVFTIGEKVLVYRGSSDAAANRIGKGTLNRVNPTAYTGTGSIVRFAVSNGDQVKRGDLLFETLDGAFDGFYMSGTDIVSDAAGVIATLNLQQGAGTQKGGTVAVLYPEGSMRIEADVNEGDLVYVNVGDPVLIELLWNQDEEVTYDGTISGISAVANAVQGSDEASFTVYIDFTPDEHTRYGMNAVVYTVEKESETSDAEELTNGTAQ